MFTEAKIGSSQNLRQSKVETTTANRWMDQENVVYT